MTVFNNLKSFTDRAGPISCNRQLSELGLSPCGLLGEFTMPQASELLEFCNANSNYHIVTLLNPNVYLNRYTSAGRIFRLANGDSDKSIIFDARWSPDTSRSEF